ncbi:DMT family transporter [bacterium]|nr:DMT family transporter [bacterium]
MSLADINPVILVGYRLSLASLILGIILFFLKKPLFGNIEYGFILGFLLWILYVPQTIGLEYTSSSNSAFITGLFVAFMPIFTLLFYRKLPNLLSFSAIVLSLMGLWFLTGGLKGINSGDLMTLITAMSYAAHIFFVDKYVKGDFDPYVLSFQQFFFVGILSVITSILFKLPFSYGTTKTVWIILFLTLFPTLSAFVIQLVAQKFTVPIKVALILSLEPVFGAIFSWTLGGEEFVPIRAFGGLLIFAAMLIYQLSGDN